MPSKENVESIKKLEEKLKANPNLVVTIYQGLKTPEINDLRSKLKPLGCEYTVVKNTLTQIALKNIGLENFAKYFTGPTAVAFQKGDPTTISKTMVEFSKTNEKFKIVAGYLAGQILDEKQIKILATLPSREVLLAKIAIMLNQPIQQIATVLNAPIQNLAVVLKALEQKKQQA